MSRTSVAEVCLLILADNRGIATYLLVCIAPVLPKRQLPEIRL